MYLFGCIPLLFTEQHLSIHAPESARLSVYKMFVCLEVVAHRQLRYVVGEREQKSGACRERCSPVTHQFVIFIPHQRKMFALSVLLSKLLCAFYLQKNGLNHNIRVVLYVVFRNFRKNQH